MRVRLTSSVLGSIRRASLPKARPAYEKNGKTIRGAIVRRLEGRWPDLRGGRVGPPSSRPEKGRSQN